MKFLRRWFVNLATRNPRVERLLDAANRVVYIGDTMREASKVETMMGQEIEVQIANLKRRMTEMLELRNAELACIAPEQAVAFSESHRDPVESVAQFKERLWELELALEDRGWVREVTLSNLEFSRLGIQQLTRICRIMALKNPLVKRAAILCRLYVFGRGVEIRVDDDAANEVVQEFLDANQAELGHTGLASKEQDIQTDGSLYFALPTDPKGNVGCMMIDPLEIMDQVTDPDNSTVPRYFYRMWSRASLDPTSGVTNNEPKKCWYPSLELVEGLASGKIKSTARIDVIGGVNVNWDMPILRSRDAETPSSWRWAVPPLYALIDWARAYKDFLEDWATIQRALSRFSLMVETKGGQGAIAAYQALLSTTFADANGTQIEKNPPPVRGSAHVSGPGNTITPFKTAGTQTSPDQARRIGLMGCSAAGLPETMMFGDASTGSLATAVSLDRPTELKFTEIQRRWRYTLTRIVNYALMVSRTTPGGRLREARQNNPAPQPVKITVEFPNVIEHSIKDAIQAIVEVATLGGRNGIPAGIVDTRTFVRLLLKEIGVVDIDDVMEQMGYGEGYDAKADIERQRTSAAPQDITSTDPNAPKPGKKKVTEAQRSKRSKKLREAVAAGATEKAWIGGTCEDCMENSEAGFIPEDEVFPSGDDEPPAHPNCDCDLETRDSNG